jgi:hypothetical protein
LKGVWVSAHPDVILKMGVKEVLHRTRHLGWGHGHPAVSQRCSVPKALIPPPPEGFGSGTARPAHHAPELQALRTKLENEWTPQMLQLLGIDASSLPVIWDVDFL